MLRTFIKNAFKAAGYSVSRYDATRDADAVRHQLLNRIQADMVLDVGANAGQYGRRLRRLGYQGRIVSFEPLSVAYSRLHEAAGADTRWCAENTALGDHDGTATINIAGNSWSSSLLDMLPLHLQAAPESAYVGTETIRVARLDSVFDHHVSQDDKVFLKIDTQGFTSKVLAGGEQSLGRIAGLEVELSTYPLYRDEPLIHEVLASLSSRGFNVFYLEPEVVDQATGKQLQLNGLFLKEGEPYSQGAR